jgi:hypothetical protein
MRDPEVVFAVGGVALVTWAKVVGDVRRAWRRRSAPPRMGPAEVRAKRFACGERDGWWCQQCTKPLDPYLPHRHPDYPQVHHLRAWSRNRHQPWVNEMWNLCLLCARCNRAVGTGTTWRLRRHAARLRRAEAERPRWWRLAA